MFAGANEFAYAIDSRLAIDITKTLPNEFAVHVR
jgi:methyl coenzyme M reductase alpha subunit